ncbi:hypothetical protein [Altibacter sp. HG106]|uniref:hypothetical protein n=1 Tax=Altibacter sp. HG106 TaxID=3023937 RepID=UPI002350E533|nr:hypothetical protein [Altibacter sp. HG106]MDC7996331.1 hypothetical protein [Altibacter sp. HG106]
MDFTRTYLNFSIIPVVLIILIVSCQHNSESKKTSESQPITLEIDETTNLKTKLTKDVYSDALKVLDEFKKSDLEVMSGEVLNSINFLVMISGYEGSGDKTHYGTMGFNNEDLKYWKEWYEKNKDSLEYEFDYKAF